LSGASPALSQLIIIDAGQLFTRVHPELSTTELLTIPGQVTVVVVFICPE
jgi:hypothetical protein